MGEPRSPHVNNFAWGKRVIDSKCWRVTTIEAIFWFDCNASLEHFSTIFGISWLMLGVLGSIGEGWAGSIACFCFLLLALACFGFFWLALAAEADTRSWGHFGWRCLLVCLLLHAFAHFGFLLLASAWYCLPLLAIGCFCLLFLVFACCCWPATLLEFKFKISSTLS